MVVTPGETKVFLMENAQTQIFTHVEKEICSGLVNGTNKAYTVTTAPNSFIGNALTGTATALVQYVDGTGINYFRRDVLVFYRKDGRDTVVDTTSNAVTISTTTLTFATAPTTAQADKVIASYFHTPSDRSDEIVAMNVGGGGRPVEYVTVQGGLKIRVAKSQEPKSVSFEVLSVDGGFVAFVNGVEVSQTSGSELIKGSVGNLTRTRRTIATVVSDPETGNKRVECFFNVVGVTNEGTAPSEGHWSETCGFECPPQDYCRLTFLNNQG